MSGFLIAVPAVALLAALAIIVLQSTPATAARMAITASAVAFAAAVVTLIAVGVDGPFGVVATGSDGDAIVGLAADRVGAILIVLTTLVGLIVQSFASRSLRGDLRARRFHVLALVLTASTTLVAIAATGTGFVIGWIATSVVLVALIGHRAPWPPAVAAQRRTGWSFLIGDSVLVVAMVVTLVLVGDIDLRSVGAGAASLDAEQIAGVNALTVVATLLVLAGIARSALVPIHRWLPATLAAPTPVSALLHAGVINGAGVLLIRFSPIFASSATAMAVAFAIGMLTALLATAVMLVRTDVKGGLVWSTAGQMGFMVMQLGVGAFAAALFHIVGHAMYKAAMFLGAGGAISAHLRQQQRPHLGLAAQTTLTSWPIRLLIGLIVPLASFALALAVIDPHLTASATILIVVFGVLSVGRAANGWIGSTPFGVARTIATAAIGICVGVFAYVGGVTVFEHFVVDVVPYDVPAAVGPVWVTATLIGIAILVAVIALTPGPRGQELRRRVYVWLVSTGAATPRPFVASPPRAPRPPASAN
jgi:NADH:ubiquinone oxidoreductase subunit 5 (subunit L)/multisubunit Na+/H+ antiporter MnhA subunit